MLSSRPRILHLTLLLILACGRDEPTEGEAHVAHAPQLVPHEEWRVGSVNDPNAGFSHIGGVAVDAAGLIYVLETQDRQVRVYDYQGGLLRRIGREGEGPGEFKSPSLIGIQHDTLAVVDLNLNRVTLFLGTGQLVETVPTPPVWLEPAPGLYMMVAPVGFTRDGFASRVVRIMLPPEIPRDSIPVPHVALDRTGQITDTLRIERWHFAAPEIRIGSLTVRVPTGPPAGPLYIDGREDTYVVERPVAAAADRAEFTITRLTQTGDTIFRRSIHYRPSTFSAEAIDGIVAQAVRPYLRNPDADSGAIAATVRQALSLPPYQPPIVGGRIGADEVLWLQLQGDGTAWHEWVLVGPEGHLHGRVGIPRNATIHWSSGDLALVVVPDDFDVPWLIRYRLRGQDAS